MPTRSARGRRPTTRPGWLGGLTVALAAGLTGCAAGADPPTPQAATVATATTSTAVRPSRPAPRSSTAPRRTTRPTTRPATLPTSAPRNAEGFAPVVTDRIPAPTVPIGINDPVPGLTNMQAPARAAFTAAFAAERTVGLAPTIASAWRSTAWQQVLFDRAVTRYGSATEANRWVLRPLQSAHVKGYAVDVHPQSAAAWLETHGSTFGLCRIYANEWWHFEYRATRHCPGLRPDATG